jgi:hypothetical protein
MVPTPSGCAGGWKISMSRFVSPVSGAPPFSDRPEVMRVSPLGSSVCVGYQRPCRMFGWRCHVSLNGLNV